MSKLVLSYLISKGYTSQESAKKLGVSQRTVLRFAKKFGLVFNNIPKRSDTIEPRVISKLINRGYTDIEISKLLNINRTSVNRVCVKKGYIKEYTVKLNKRVKSVLIGTLLGDSSLSKRLKTRLTCCHGLIQKDYCIWKSKQLSCLKTKVVISKRVTPDKRNGLYYEAATLYTQSTNSLNDLHDMLYLERGKDITKEALKWYNDLSLAIHFMDDGCKNKSSYELATHSFSKEGLEIFNEFCQKKFNITWTIRKDNSLYLPSKYKDRFTNLVKKHIHPTLIYKLHRCAQ